MTAEVLKNQKIIIIENKGVLYMSDRSVTNYGTMTNSQINTGDNSHLSANWGVEDQNKFEEFIKLVKEAPGLSSDEVEDSVEILNDLKNKKESNTLRLSFLEKMWQSLPQAVTVIKGAADIYNMFSA